MKIDEVRSIFQNMHPDYINLEKGVYCAEVSKTIFSCIEIIPHRTYGVNMRVKIGLRNFPTVEKSFISHGKGLLKTPDSGNKIKSVTTDKSLQYLTYDIIDNKEEWPEYIFYTKPGNHKFSDEKGNITKWFDFMTSLLSSVITQCSTEKGILEFLQEEKNGQKIRFGFWNYTSHPYVYYFLLKKLKHDDVALKFLSELEEVQHLSQSDVELLRNTEIPN